MDRSKSNYKYRFSNGESHTMTPVEAHGYAHKHKIDIWEGPAYQNGRRERFTGWGWHAALQRSFKGPNDYKTYLRENNLTEAGNERAPLWQEPEKPIWTEELLRKAVREYGLDISDSLGDALLRGELDYPEDAHVIDLGSSARIGENGGIFID